MAASSSSHSSLVSAWKYGIFLSFYGKDTRKNFTDHLYDALVRHRINTFRDDNSLERGVYISPGLLRAIEESWGSIIILSKGYAFSSWCLIELAKILEQKKEKGHIVYPIFYHVDPSDLRHQKNTVNEAFAQHEGRFSAEEIQRWRDALYNVATISGWPSDNEYESDFIKKIVKDIFVKLSQTNQIYSRLEELLHSTLKPGQNDDVRIIGICGKSGIGKTALARVVYTQMSPHFEAKSFLVDVGEASRNIGLVSLQKQLLFEILPGETFNFSETREGIVIINHWLPHKKALIVIDGIDSIHQLQCLVGKKDWFGSGCRVIVTARDERLLQSFGVDDMCKPTTLDAESTGAVTSDVKMNEVLKRKLEELNGAKEGLESRMSKELHQGKKLKKGVELWLRDTERTLGERSDSSSGLFRPHVSKKIVEIEGLIQQVRSFDGLVIDAPAQWIGQALLTTKLFGEAAKTCMKDIWAYLMGDDVSKIGVVGMGGVGKTTIMKLIHNQLLKETERFNIVIWVTVSKEVNIFKLQKTIARAMNEVLFEDDDETIIAGKIGEMLDRKGKYVLILDDLWEEQFSLEEVGIPEPCNGSKLLVTTRLSHVCRNLDCREVRVPTLSKADAWSLFLEKVGQEVLNYPDVLSIVKSVAEECGGLPLAIVTIASSMKGVLDIREWRNALNELKRNVRSVSKMEEKVFQQLQFSYDCLRDEKMKQCFLSCALYPEDHNINIDGLIELWIAEGLVEEMESMRDEIDKGHTILNKLKNSCLVESDTIDKSCVKMHDVVRDMALRIQSGSGKPRVLVKAGMQLRVIPDVQEWNEDLEKVSLMLNEDLKIPPQMRPPNCQKLTTLLLSSCSIESIPECFFEHVRGLKTLDLSWNHKIKRLPNSISNLEALSTLLLCHCSDLEEVPSLSKLVALKKLDLSFTRVADLPDGMLERLVNLKYLQLARKEGKEKGGKVADGIFAKLTCLRHLAIKSRYLKGDGLRNLEYFEGRFFDLNEFICYVDALVAEQKLPMKYWIYVGKEAQIYYTDYLHEKIVTIHDGKVSQGGIKIPSNVESLEIVNCNTVELCEEKAFFGWLKPVPHDNFSSLSFLCIAECRKIKKLFPSPWVLQNLQSLDRLVVERCQDMEEIITMSELEGIGTTKSIPLPKLKRLELKDLPELKSICSVNGVMVCDSLQMTGILNCPKLKNLFSLEGALQPNLKNLKKLHVEGCQEMEEIITISESEGIGTIKSLTLPQLHTLNLKDLPELKSICSANGVMICGSIRWVCVLNCPKLKRVSFLDLPLSVDDDDDDDDDGQPSPFPHLQGLNIEPREQWEWMEWEHPNVKSLLEPLVICSYKPC